MRIGYVTGEYPPMEGGVGAFTRELALAVSELGHDTHVFTREAAQSSHRDGIVVDAAVGKTWGWRTLGQARQWARARQLDIVNIQFQTAAFNMRPAIHWLPAFLRSGATRVIVTFHDLRVPYLFPKAGMLRAWVLRKMSRDAAGVIVTDRVDEATLRESGDAGHLRWIPIGSNVRAVTPSAHHRSSRRKALRVGPSQLLISYFGFLNESKGGLALIDALAELVAQGFDAHVIMIGGRAGASDPTNFAYGQRVDQRIAELHLNKRIHWSGFVNDAEVSEWFYASDICALPYTDGVSLRRGTLMAALAHGRAIITTMPDRPTPELEGVVKIIQRSDPKALADGILMLWRDKSLRECLAQNALKASRLFAWDGIAKRTVEFYEEILADV